MRVRSIDGSGIRADDASANAAGTAFLRLAEARFADGVSRPMDGPNPRTVSNLVVGEGEADVSNDLGLSGMMYAWGQFIDHDLTRTPIDQGQPFDVAVADGDATFAQGTRIPAGRAVTDPRTGTGPDNPAMAINAVTGWLDASMVYGSDPVTAASLRLPDGRMRVSEGDNLPVAAGRFVAGDVRAAENPSLTALQTLFLREHNHWADRLQAELGLTGDALYQQARAIVAAEIAQVTYAEFLPHLLGADAIPKDSGFDSTTDPRIALEFAGAAFRWGHSTVSPVTERKSEQGEVMGEEMSLRDAFFLKPDGFAEHGGADGFLRHLGSDVSQAMDVRIVEDLRSFLFDPPVGQDLAAINIQRGRDLGLPTLNGMREALGLTTHASFDSITGDTATAKALSQAFGDIDRVDLWTGGLAEQPVPGALIGETFSAIVADQFTRLRDGDPLWFTRAGLDPALVREVEATRLSDIVLRNTDTRSLQEDMFLYHERRAPEATPEDPEAPQLVVGDATDEILEGGPANDILDGGDGTDTARYRSGLSETRLTRQADGSWIAEGLGGRDRLVGVEAVQFNDARVLLDAAASDWSIL